MRIIDILHIARRKLSSTNFRFFFHQRHCYFVLSLYCYNNICNGRASGHYFLFLEGSGLLNASDGKYLLSKKAFFECVWFILFRKEHEYPLDPRADLEFLCISGFGLFSSFLAKEEQFWGCLEMDFRLGGGRKGQSTYG